MGFFKFLLWALWKGFVQTLWGAFALLSAPIWLPVLAIGMWLQDKWEEYNQLKK